MFFFIYFFMAAVVAIAVVNEISREKRGQIKRPVRSSYSNTKSYASFLQERDTYDEDFDNYANYAASNDMADRDYFSDDLADDYCSYYAQIADDADMGDSDAMEEMYGEFGGSGDFSDYSDSSDSYGGEW